jgi:hypothetical protein
MNPGDFFSELKRRNIRGAHAPSRAIASPARTDDALVIANFVSSRVGPTPMKDCFGEAPKPARDGACAPRNVISASRRRK